MNRRNLIKTATLGAAGAVFTGTLPSLHRAENLAVQMLAAEMSASDVAMSQALRWAVDRFRIDNPTIPVTDEDVDLCARQLDTSERWDTRTGSCSAGQLSVIFDRSNPDNVQIRGCVRVLLPVSWINVSISV